MIFRDPIDIKTLTAFAIGLPTAYSAWLTSLVFTSVHGMRPLLIADAIFFPIGVVHGIGVWFGGW